MKKYLSIILTVRCSVYAQELTTNCSVFEEVSLVIIRNIFSNNFNVIVTQLYK